MLNLCKKGFNYTRSDSSPAVVNLFKLCDLFKLVITYELPKYCLFRFMIHAWMVFKEIVFKEEWILFPKIEKIKDFLQKNLYYKYMDVGINGRV